MHLDVFAAIIQSPWRLPSPWTACESSAGNKTQPQNESKKLIPLATLNRLRQIPTWNCGTVISKDLWQICPEGSAIFSSRHTYGELRDRHVSELTVMPSFHCMSTSWRESKGGKCEKSRIQDNFSPGRRKPSEKEGDLDIPGWCWAWTGSPAERGLKRRAHSTTCATPEGKLWATCYCPPQAQTRGDRQRACSFRLTWRNKC